MAQKRKKLSDEGDHHERLEANFSYPKCWELNPEMYCATSPGLV